MPATEELTGRDLMRRLNSLAQAEETRRLKERQPAMCKGCIWGRWEGSKQFCSRPVCVKELSKR